MCTRCMCVPTHVRHTHAGDTCVTHTSMSHGLSPHTRMRCMCGMMYLFRRYMCDTHVGHTYESHVCGTHVDTHTGDTCVAHVCNMCATPMAYMWLYVVYASITCYTCVPHTHVCHTRVSTNACMWYTPLSVMCGTHIYESWPFRTHMREMHVWDSFSHITHMNESRHTCERVMSHICMSHVAHVNESDTRA